MSVIETSDDFGLRSLRREWNAVIFKVEFDSSILTIPSEREDKKEEKDSWYVFFRLIQNELLWLRVRYSRDKETAA